MNPTDQHISELSQPSNVLGKISQMFIERFRVVYLIIIGILLMGFIVYSGMPREEMPEVSIKMISVNVTYQGVSASDIESLITEPLENVLDSVEDLDAITSTSKTGNASIILNFEEQVDMDDALTTVRNNVANVNLPEGAMDPVIMEFKTSEMPIMKMTITGDVSMTDLKHYGEVIQEEIEGIEGISEVALSGGYTREIQIQLKQSELTKYNMTVNEIIGSIQNSEFSTPLNSMGLEGENFNLRFDETFTTLEDIENIVIRSDANSYIVLSDIANVADGFKTPSEYSYYYINDGSEDKASEPAIYLQVYRDDGYDMVQPAEDIKTMLSEDKDSLLPENVNIVITADDSVEVTEELNTVLNSALSGFLVVIIVLFLFIGLNEALIVASVIPLSLFISVIFLDLSGMTFNTLTLTGFIIALGLLVDNAIVILENVDRLRDLGIDRVRASRVGSNQVAPAVFAASLTTIVAFLPLLVMEGTIGEMIRSLPLTIVFSIIASFMVSIVVTPALTSRFLSKYKGGHKAEVNMSRFSKSFSIYGSTVFVAALSLYAFKDFGWFSLLIALAIAAIMYVRKTKFTYGSHDESQSISYKYKSVITKILSKRKYRVTVVLSSILMFFLSLSLLVIGDVAVELFPVEDPDSLTISVTAPEGYLLEDTRAIVYKIEDLLFEYDDIESFNSSMGSDTNQSMMNASTSSSNEAQIEVDLKEDRQITGIDLLDMIRNDMTQVAGANIIVDAAISKGPSSEDLSVSLVGDNRAELEKIGDLYYQALIATDGVVNPNYSSTSGAKELLIHIDDLKLGKYGYTAASFSQELRNRINGIKTTTFTDNDDEVDITVYVDQDAIDAISDFDSLFFTSVQGETFQFSEVASMEVAAAISSIAHSDGQNIVTISADVHPNMNLTEVVADFNSRTDAIVLPKGVEEDTGGGFRDISDTTTSMALGLLAAILLVYIILSIQFNSLHQPLVILFSVPLAITGVMFGLQLTGNNLGFYAMMGIIALVGIAVNDAIVLLDYINYLRAQGIEKTEAIVEGVRTRFTPVFATSITTIGGILPLAVFNDTYGQLGIALIFGLIASTLLTLLVIPVIYSGLDTIASTFKSKTGIFVEESHEAKLLEESL